MAGDPVGGGSPVGRNALVGVSVDAALAPFSRRPEPDPAVLALAAAAADQLWTWPVRPADETDPAHRVWRFSGRWWSKPTPLRRERPWAGR
jgi:hypothetical protein